MGLKHVRLGELYGRITRNIVVWVAFCPTLWAYTGPYAYALQIPPYKSSAPSRVPLLYRGLYSNLMLRLKLNPGSRALHCRRKVWFPFHVFPFYFLHGLDNTGDATQNCWCNAKNHNALTLKIIAGYTMRNISYQMQKASIGNQQRPYTRPVTHDWSLLLHK